MELVLKNSRNCKIS